MNTLGHPVGYAWIVGDQPSCTDRFCVSRWIQSGAMSADLARIDHAARNEQNSRHSEVHKLASNEQIRGQFLEYLEQLCAPTCIISIGTFFCSVISSDQSLSRPSWCVCTLLTCSFSVSCARSDCPHALATSCVRVCMSSSNSLTTLRKADKNQNVAIGSCLCLLWCCYVSQEHVAAGAPLWIPMYLCHVRTVPIAIESCVSPSRVPHSHHLISCSPGSALQSLDFY